MFKRKHQKDHLVESTRTSRSDSNNYQDLAAKYLQSYGYIKKSPRQGENVKIFKLVFSFSF